MGKDETIETPGPSQQEKERTTEDKAPAPGDAGGAEAGGKNAKKRAMQFDFQAMFAQTIQSAKSKGGEEEPDLGTSLRIGADDGEELSGNMRAPKFSLASSGDTSGVEEGDEDDDDVGPALPPGFRPAASAINAAKGDDDGLDGPVSSNSQSTHSFSNACPLLLASHFRGSQISSITTRHIQKMASSDKSDERLIIEGQEDEGDEENVEWIFHTWGIQSCLSDTSNRISGHNLESDPCGL